MNDLFLSYARSDDEPFVRALYERLTAAGLTVWFDRQKMPNRGLTFSENIKRAVLDSKRLALIVGPAALKSDYVTKEWRTAYSACIPIIPLLRLSDFSDLPTVLSRVDAPDFRGDSQFDHWLEYLLRQVREAVPPPGELYGMRWFQLPRGYILRDALWRELDEKVRGDAISAQVATSREQLTALQGMAGLGKTVMAAAYVQDGAVRRTFDHGIFWLTAGRTAAAFTLHVNLAKMMGIPTDDFTPDNSREKITALLANKRALIVLDDVWNHELVKDGFQPALSEHCRLLFTTRNARLVTRTQAQRVPVETLNTDQGVRLIGRWLDRPETDDIENNPHLESERAIVDLLKGHTLAVTLAAARIDEEGAAYAPTLLDEYKAAQAGENPFADLEIADDDKDWSVELSLQLSYEALTETQRARFRQLGVIAENASFKHEMVASIWTEETARPGLRELAQAALLDSEPDGRFVQHPVLRAYAAALLRRESEYDATFLRYADTIIVWAEEFHKLPPEKWAHLDTEADHFLTVGDTLTANYTNNDDLRQRGGDFAYNITRYLEMRREVQRPRWLEMGLTIAQTDTDQKREALFLNELGGVWDALGEKRKAMDYYEQALSLIRAVGNRSGEATTLNNIGGAWDALGEKRKAMDYYEQALPLYRAMGDRFGEATTLNNIGKVWSDLGEKRQALDFYQQALPIHREVGNRTMEATTLNNIGRVWSDLGEKRQALDFYQQALPIHREVGNRTMEATTLNNIGRIWDDLGDKRQALDFFEQSLPLLRAVGDRSGEAATLNNIGMLWSDLGEKRQALDFFEQALPLKQAVGDRSGEAITLNNIGMLWSDLGEKRQALDFFEQSLPLGRAVDNRFGEALTLFNMSFLVDDPAQAIDMVQQAYNLLTAIKSPYAQHAASRLAELKGGGNV